MIPMMRTRMTGFDNLLLYLLLVVYYCILLLVVLVILVVNNRQVYWIPDTWKHIIWHQNHVNAMISTKIMFVPPPIISLAPPLGGAIDTHVGLIHTLFGFRDPLFEFWEFETFNLTQVPWKSVYFLEFYMLPSEGGAFSSAPWGKIIK